MRIRRTPSFLTAALAAGLILAAPLTAIAHEKPANITAVWWAQGTNQWPVEGQTLAASKLSDTLDLAFVKAEAEKLGCGFTIQGDLYANDKVTTKLLDGGKLYGPSNPAESWPGGSYKGEYSTVFYTGECPVVPDKPLPLETNTSSETVSCDSSEIVTTATRTVTDWVLVDNVWVPAEPVVTVTSSSRPATVADLDGATCPTYVKPDDLIVVTYTDPTFDCDTRTVTGERVTTTQSWQLVDRVWVASEPTEVRTPVSRPMTDAEVAEQCPTPPLVCEVGLEESNGVCVPVDEPCPNTDCTPAPPVTPPTDTLPAKITPLVVTGVDGMWALWFAAGLAAVGAALVIRARRKEKNA